MAWSGSITKTPARLGVEPLRLLFARVAGPIASEAMPGCFWRGLRLTAIDGSTLDVPNSPANRAVFDGPSNDAGPGAFPQVRLLVHAECGTKALLNADFDGYRSAETVLTGRILASFGPGMLILADRNFPAPTETPTSGNTLIKRHCAVGAGGDPRLRLGWRVQGRRAGEMRSQSRLGNRVVAK
ncbi:MAG: hypothetical protein QOH97_1554 [Actinoplanes sp.]|nr:hypothetical protein [Actinoplanes sp.]